MGEARNWAQSQIKYLLRDALGNGKLQTKDLGQRWKTSTQLTSPSLVPA
jgi:hypothetical protein